MPHRSTPYDPVRIGADDPVLPAILDLIRNAFAGMDGQIDPPSSMHRLSVESLAQQAETAEIWAIGQPPFACVILTPKQDRLYIGKLAVAADQTRKGHAATLVALAETRARALGLATLELETRVELVENQAVFQRLGFVETTRTAHAGFNHPTSITYQKHI